MNCHDLRDFLARLQATGELQTVTAAVSPLLEIAAVTDRVCKGDAALNKALLFTAVTGSDYRVATNLFGSEARVAAAFGLDRLTGLTARLTELLAEAAGATALEKLAALPQTGSWQAAAPVLGSTVPSCLEENAAGLAALPLLKSHPLDGQPDHAGRFLTLPLVITADPAGNACNCGIYRAAPVDNETLAISWSATSGAARHAAAWQGRPEPMPVTIALGGPPLLTFAAMLPLPAAVDEFGFCGALQGAPLALYRGANGLPAPAGAEAVLEGYLLPAPVPSGAFGNHTGSYTPTAPAAAIRVTSVRCRPDMILPATVVGRPPMEDCWLARAGGYLALALLQQDIPAVTALHLPFAGIFHGAAIISAAAVAGSGPALLGRIRENPWFARSKLLVLVDAGQDPADTDGVLWRIMNNVRPEQDLVVSNGSVAIDATRKEGAPLPVVADPQIAALVEKRWKEYGFAR